MSSTLAWDLIARDRASSTFDKVGNRVESTGSKFKKFGTIAKAGALAAGAGLLYLGKKAVDFAKAAAEDEAAAAKLALTLKNTAGATDAQISATEAWITAQGKALGVTDDELRPALQRLAEATGDVTKAQELASVAMDVAAGTGRSLKSVTEAMLRASNGSVSGLSRYGIATKNAAGETMTFDQVVKNMSETFGGQAANAADTAQGKYARLKLILSETGESIGAKLLPVATKFAGWMLDTGLPAAEKLASGIGDKLGPAFTKVAGWVQDKLLPALSQLGKDVMPSVRAAAEMAGFAFQQAQPFFALVGKIVVNVLLPMLGKLAKVVLPGLGGALVAVGTMLRLVGKAGQWMWNNALQPVFKFIVSAVGKVLTWFGKMLQLIGQAPKMGWVGELGDKLVGAGGKATGLADKIRDIPDRHDTTLNVHDEQAKSRVGAFAAMLGRLPQSHTVNLFANWVGDGPGDNPLIPGSNANGTGNWRGGWTWVGERGRELVNLPRGSQVVPNAQSEAMAGIDYRALARELVRALREGLPIVQLRDEGRAAYLRMGGF